MSKHLSPAYQLYSAREDASNDLEGVLDQLARMGYEGVEFAGFFEKTAKEVRKLLKHTGLKAVSSHVPLQQIRDDMQSVLDYHEELECGCIAVPYLAEEDRPGQPGFAHVLETLYTFGRQCKKRDITLLYHNHDFEFVTLPDGTFGFDDIYTQIPEDLLKVEPDLCWIKVAGQNPIEYLKKYGARCEVVHLKDFYKEGNPKNMYKLIGIETEEEEGDTGIFEFRPVGFGLQVWEPILKTCVEIGSRWVIVEQDEHYELDPMEAARRSREYLKILGW